MTVSDDRKPSMVHLVPTTKSRPIRYVEGIERAGMIVDLKHSIAMYVSKSIPSVGPQGPPGDDLNSKFDTIIASCSDEPTPIPVGGPKTTFRAPYRLDLTNGYIRASLTNAPTGSSFIIDVTMNGVSMFSTPLSIDVGEKTSVTAAVPAVLAIVDVPDDAEFLVYVLQQDSSQTASGLKVAVTGIKIDPPPD